jgi:hypothetical protein
MNRLVASVSLCALAAVTTACAEDALISGLIYDTTGAVINGR